MKIALMVALLAVGSASAQDVTRPTAPAAGEPKSSSIFYDGTHFGLQLDAGFPAGGTAALVVRPWKFLRINGGIAYDVVALGYKGGVTLIPFHWAIVPTLSLEAGHFNEGNVNDVYKIEDKAASILLSKVGYDYVSADVGLEFGAQNRFVFYVRGGLTRIYSTANNVTAALNAANAGSVSSTTTYNVPKNAKLEAGVPAVRLGFIIYMF